MLTIRRMTAATAVIGAIAIAAPAGASAAVPADAEQGGPGVATTQIVAEQSAVQGAFAAGAQAAQSGFEAGATAALGGWQAGAAALRAAFPPLIGPTLQ
jgi:hypothetical protein